MPDTHIAVAQEVDRYAAHRAAAAAAAKAKRMWPDVIGDVLAEEIMAMLDLPPWLRSQTRTQRLIDTILSITEVRGDAAEWGHGEHVRRGCGCHRRPEADVDDLSR
jgi:hypothetical protein